MLDNDYQLIITFFTSRDMMVRYGRNSLVARNLLDDQGLWDETRFNIGLTLSRDFEKVSEALFGASRTPILVVWHKARLVFCGVDRSVIISSWEHQFVRHHSTIGVIVRFYLSQEEDYLLCWSVDGITCFDETGQKIWYWSDPDVVSDVEVQLGTVVVTGESGSARWCLDIGSGRQV